MAAKAKAKTKTAEKKTTAKKAATGKSGASKSSASKTSKTSAGKTTAKAKKTSSSKSTSSKSKATTKAAASTTKKTKATAKAAAAIDSQFRNFTPYEPGKSELYMSDDQLVHFRQILMNWRQELMEEVDRTVTHMKDEAANFPDPADRATQEEEFSIELRTRDRERKLIKKIENTIERVDQEDYGYCDTCGIEIGLRRLEARPTATQCVDCKALDEIKEKQIRG